MNELINDDAVYRTAPATPDLLNTALEGNMNIEKVAIDVNFNVM